MKNISFGLAIHADSNIIKSTKKVENQSITAPSTPPKRKLRYNGLKKILRVSNDSGIMKNDTTWNKMKMRLNKYMSK